MQKITGSNPVLGTIYSVGIPTGFFFRGKMNTKLLTSIIMAVVTVGLIAYDIWVAIESTTHGDTISEILGALSIDLGFVTYAWGVLTSHLLIHRNSVKKRSVSQYVYLSLASVSVLLLSIYGPHISSIVYLLSGLVAGWMWWPQFKQNLEEL